MIGARQAGVLVMAAARRGGGIEATKFLPLPERVEGTDRSGMCSQLNELSDGPQFILFASLVSLTLCNKQDANYLVCLSFCLCLCLPPPVSCVSPRILSQRDVMSSTTAFTRRKTCLHYLPASSRSTHTSRPLLCRRTA